MHFQCGRRSLCPIECLQELATGQLRKHFVILSRIESDAETMVNALKCLQGSSYRSGEDEKSAMRLNLHELKCPDDIPVSGADITRSFGRFECFPLQTRFLKAWRKEA